MKTILLINLLIGYITLAGVLIIGMSVVVLKHFPSSKFSGVIRNILITDEDLEPIEGDESQSSTEGTNS